MDQLKLQSLSSSKKTLIRCRNQGFLYWQIILQSLELYFLNQFVRLTHHIRHGE